MGYLDGGGAVPSSVAIGAPGAPTHVSIGSVVAAGVIGIYEGNIAEAGI